MQAMPVIHDNAVSDEAAVATVMEGPTLVALAITRLGNIDVASKNTARITAVNHRVDVVQKILFAVATAAISALFTALIGIAQMFLLH